MLALIKKSLLTAAVLVFAALPALSTTSVAAVDEASKEAACTGIGQVGGTDCGGSGTGSEIQRLVAAAVNILSWIVGVAAVIMIIIGGFKYVTSNGDANGTSGAKNTILYAVIGLVVAALAQALVQFVLNKTTPQYFGG